MANSRAENAQMSLVRRANDIWIDTSYYAISSILQQEKSVLRQIRSSQIHKRLPLSRSYRSDLACVPIRERDSALLALANNILKRAHGKKRRSYTKSRYQLATQVQTRYIELFPRKTNPLEIERETSRQGDSKSRVLRTRKPPQGQKQGR